MKRAPKIIQCKTCNQEISANAKSCPHCGAKNKRPFYKKWWFWLIVAFIVIGAASSGNDSGSTDDTTNPPASSSPVDSDTTGNPLKKIPLILNYLLILREVCTTLLKRITVNLRALKR